MAVEACVTPRSVSGAELSSSVQSQSAFVDAVFVDAVEPVCRQLSAEHGIALSYRVNPIAHHEEDGVTYDI